MDRQVGWSDTSFAHFPLSFVPSTQLLLGGKIDKQQIERKSMCFKPGTLNTLDTCSEHSANCRSVSPFYSYAEKIMTIGRFLCCRRSLNPIFICQKNRSCNVLICIFVISNHLIILIAMINPAFNVISILDIMVRVSVYLTYGHQLERHSFPLLDMPVILLVLSFRMLPR